MSQPAERASSRRVQTCVPCGRFQIDVSYIRLPPSTFPQNLPPKPAEDLEPSELGENGVAFGGITAIVPHPFFAQLLHHLSSFLVSMIYIFPSTSRLRNTSML